MKKQLLKESEIRKMMKFANIGPLSNGFVERLVEQDELEDETPGGMEAGPGEGGMEDLEGVEGIEGEEGLEGEEGAGEEVLAAVGDAVDALKRALSAAGPDGQAAADAISVEGAGEEGGEELPGEEMDVEDPGAEMDLQEPGMDLGAEEESALQEVELVDEDEAVDEVVNEVTRRVARKLRLLSKRANYL